MAAYHNVFPFPQELVDMIIDDNADDHRTLKTFALVSRSCLTQSRKHLFSSIQFLTSADNPAECQKRHRRFRSILVRDPRVARYVRELLVRDAMYDPAGNRASWIREDTSFHETLRTLSANGLERFTLETELRWTSFPLSFKQALMNVFTAPSLQYVGLRGIRALPKACCIAFGAQVTDLLLVNVEIVDEVDGDLPDVLPAGRATKLWWFGIEDVSAECIGLLFDALVQPSDTGGSLPSLMALHIGPRDADAVEALWDIVQAGRETLQYFNWEYSHKSASVPPLTTQPISVRDLKKLFAMTFEVTEYPDDSDEDPDEIDHFSGLLALLGTVKVGNTFQDLCIKVNYNDLSDAQDSLAEYDGWTRLDNLLSSSSFELDDVTVEFDLQTILLEEEFGEDTDDEDVDLEDREAELRRLVQLRLPKLVNNDLLTFSLKVRGRKP